MCRKTQTQFAALFEGVSEAMQKSYEGGKAQPGILYMETLSQLAGVPTKALRERTLNRNSVTINTEMLSVEKVETPKTDKSNDNPTPLFVGGTSQVLTGAHVTLQDYIDDLRRDKETLYSLANSILDQIKLDTKTALAYQMAWVEYEAERAAKGDEQTKLELIHRMNTLVRSYLPDHVVKSNETETGKKGKG